MGLEQAVAAPLTTLKLAAAGARVIKVERSDGDFARGYDEVVRGQSAYFVWLNVGKESVVLDVKDPEDAALLRRMLAKADVFVQNLAPGAAERAGFGSAHLRREFPSLITCDITGYGSDGPRAGMKAYDNLVQGETGLLSVTGTPDEPAKVGISICDISTGMHAYGGIVEALFERERTGCGRALEVSMFDSLAHWMSVPYLHYAYGGRAPQRTGLHHASVAPYGPYAGRDGRVVLIAVGNERDWVSFCAGVLDRPEMAEAEDFDTNSKRVANREALDTIISGVLGQLPLEDIVGRLTNSNVAFGRLNSVAEISQHPQLRLVTVGTEAGPIRLAADPIRSPSPADTAAARVPALGEDTNAVRQEFAG